MPNSLPHYPMIIGGVEDPNGCQILINPATGEGFATAAISTFRQVDQAVAAARAAQPAWACLSFGERARLLLRKGRMRQRVLLPEAFDLTSARVA